MTEAISFTSSEDVFVASTASGLHSASSFAKISFLRSMFSKTASITMSQSDTAASKSSVGVMSAMQASMASCDKRPLATVAA